MWTDIRRNRVYAATYSTYCPLMTTAWRYGSSFVI